MEQLSLLDILKIERIICSLLNFLESKKKYEGLNAFEQYELEDLIVLRDKIHSIHG